MWSPLLLAFAIGALQGVSGVRTDLSIVLLPIVIPWSLLQFWIGPALAVKRLHDLNISGWFAVPPAMLGGFLSAARQEMFVALLYVTLELWLLLSKGTSGPNDYGAMTMRRRHRHEPPSGAAKVDQLQHGPTTIAKIAAAVAALLVIGWIGSHQIGGPSWWPFPQHNEPFTDVPQRDPEKEQAGRQAIERFNTDSRRDQRLAGELYAEQQRIAALLTDKKGERRDMAGSGIGFKDRLLDGELCPFCPEMVVVPAGTFKMGSPDSEPGLDWQKGQTMPQVEVTIGRSFAVAKFSVTFDEWDACVADGSCDGYRPSDEGWGRGTRPVIHVNWDDAKSYAVWLSRKTGKPYRLLSDAEREYVTRAGTSTPFWWGSAITAGEANYNSSYVYAGGGSKGEHRQRTVPVDSFSPNPWGLYQVHGNVWEWTEDCWNDGNEGNPGDGSARETGNCSLRVVRGGSLISKPDTLRSSFRTGYAAAEGRLFYYQGFRVARTLSP